mmetsp:Transcript_10448/g.31936  ORF Transcript_10448/g.31936 Transcript_10448/m.31936 type:complete len:191 (+) Transcript_10448:124-696(+)|eukprot:CAMPEP_0198734070 /NCGR_PEP_ID=MMETSP1475-20131203/50335_1 /TAXON_ID= ORGANISM="Unidentified sp., Strain CCMP1999" /NCGR_SAMPLE_ID=MMETSP1475 /ASSEMBLY_ACC=CAM_ASM_001111 /LENGTH=190 /DNA_ID=CAMNT_0044497477 /DNA_START=116 /DNA_END=688 /DNA_ORIENTATION=-
MTLSHAKPDDALKFLFLCGKLKETKRTGWVNNDVQKPESIADHMHRMALISFLVGENAENRSRLIKMAVVHDLAEAVVGDITPHDGVSKEEKRRLEETAMLDIRDNILKSSNAGNEIYELWQEYDDGITPDAQTMKQIDKFEMVVQAYEYEKAQGKDLSQFFESTTESFSTSPFTEWVASLRQMHETLQG